jgi:hypothetical protein
VKVLNKVVRGRCVALADAIGDDGAARGGQRDVGVLIALLRFMRPRALLLLANEGPQLVQFQPAGAKADHATIVQLRAAAADPERQAHDCVAVNARKALDGADRHALTEGSDDFDLLLAWKEVHSGPNPTYCGIGPKRTAGKVARDSLDYPEWSFASGPNPEVD